MNSVKARIERLEKQVEKQAPVAKVEDKPRTMITKPPWTEEEQFWRSVRRAMLELVNAVETCKLSEHIDVPTSQVRKRLKSYQQAYMYPPIAAEGVRERIAELTAEKIVELTTQAECDKL